MNAECVARAEKPLPAILRAYELAYSILVQDFRLIGPPDLVGMGPPDFGCTDPPDIGVMDPPDFVPLGPPAGAAFRP
jgi:hypothetical protein